MAENDEKETKGSKEPSIKQRIKKLREELPARAGIYEPVLNEIVDLIESTLPKN